MPAENFSIIESGLNKLKTFKEKNESELLKDLSVPSGSDIELTQETNKYKENIQKNLHASVSAKIKNIFGMQKSEKEEDRRKILNENVKNFKISLSAYEYFFKKCLGCDEIIKPLLDEYRKIYKKLCPSGKGYVTFDASQIENGTDEDYQNYLLKISNKYNFKTKNFVNITINYNDKKPKLSFKLLGFSNEKDTNNLTPYKSRAQRVYNQYREFAKKVLEAVKFELETTFSSKQLMYPTEYEELVNYIDNYAAKAIQAGASQIEGIGYICEAIEKQKNSVLEKLKQFNIELKNLKKFCSEKYLLSATRTSSYDLNEAIETLISRTGKMINHLSTLRLDLSNGRYDKSLITCKLLNEAFKNIGNGFVSYKTLKESIDLSKATPTAKNNDKDISDKTKAIRSIKEICDKEIQKLTNSINERKKSIRKAQKDSIIKILGSITPMLGNALSAINTIAGLFGVSLD